MSWANKQRRKCWTQNWHWSKRGRKVPCEWLLFVDYHKTNNVCKSQKPETSERKPEVYWEGWIHGQWSVIFLVSASAAWKHTSILTLSNCSGNFCKTYHTIYKLSRHRHSPIRYIYLINQWRIAYAPNKICLQYYLWFKHFNIALATYVWTLGEIVQSLESSLVSCCSHCHCHHCCCCFRTRNSGNPWKSPK